jgi:protease IV
MESKFNVKRGSMKEYLVWLLKIVTIIVLILFLIPALIAASAQLAIRGNSEKLDDEVVAVVELTGEILDTKEVVEQLFRQADEEKVRGIVLRIDSPGGAVGPSQEVYHAVSLIKAKKPIVVSMGSVAASGGLYAALSANKIFAHEGTLTGSIGVIGQFPNFFALTQKFGVEVVTVKSGALKDIGNPFRAMEEADRQSVQKTMDDIHRQFVQAVASGRKLDEQTVQAFADGRVMTGMEAKERGLVDELGGLHEAARAVYDELGEPLPAGEFPKLFYPDDKFHQIRDILSSVKSFVRLFQPQLGLFYKVSF